MIRHAAKEDIAQILVLAEQFFEESGYETELGVHFDVESFLLWILECAVSQEFCVFVCEQEKEIVGFLVGHVLPLFFNFKEKVSFELLWYVEPQHRHGKNSKALMLAFEEWSKTNGAKVIEVGSAKTLKMKQTSKLFERMGFPHFRNGHVKKIEVN